MQIAGADAVDAPPQSRRERLAAFIEIPVQAAQPQAEEEVLTGVRKLGARLRGTFEGGADSADGGSLPAAKDMADPHGASDEGAPASAEPAAPDATMGGDTPHDAASPSDAPAQDPAAAVAATRSAANRTPAARSAGKTAEERPAVSEPVAASSGSMVETAIEDETGIADTLETAQTEAGAAGESAPAPSPKQPLPETWQEPVAQEPVSQEPVSQEPVLQEPVTEPAKGAAAAGQADARAEKADDAVKHKPRLRRKQAASKPVADSSEARAQEDRLDAAWQETQKARPARDATGPAPAATPAADVPGRAGEEAVEASVPVLDDGPPAGNAVPVSAQVSSAAQEAVADAAGSLAGASGDSEAAYDFSVLLARLRENQRQDRGQRVLVSGLGDAARLRLFGEKLSQAGARAGRCILVSMQDDGLSGNVPGLSDLIAERASFFDVIRRDRASPLHRVERGRADAASLTDDDDGLDIALTAFQHTYGLVFMLMPDPSDAALLKSLAGAADTVIIAADREADDPELVDLYARVAGMGSADVVVAGVGRRAGVAAA